MPDPDFQFRQILNKFSEDPQSRGSARRQKKTKRIQVMLTPVEYERLIRQKPEGVPDSAWIRRVLIDLDII